MTITIRPARQEDQNTIVNFIRQAHLNSRKLNWERFLVAEEDGRVVGVRQVRIHSSGTREVGSGFVLPDYRSRGISAQLMNEILSREKGSLYLMCRDKWIPYYEQFGFRQTAVHQLPTDIRKEYRIGRFITSFISFFQKDKIRIIPMRREAP
jgi:N-acetylglutamate synthase-like GNAT family acetyltransferase